MVDRKTLIRRFKETPTQMGVFRIHNTTENKTFLGVSRDVPAALNRHRAQLNMNAHPQKELQDDWNRLGNGVFVFELLDTLSHDKRPDFDPTRDLRELEQLWLEKIAPEGHLGYPTRLGRVL